MQSLQDYEAWKNDQKAASRGAAELVLSSAQEKPDQVAGDMNLATEFGKVTGKPVPPLPMVQEYRSVLQQEVEKSRASTILASSPRLTEWLRNPENAAIARDDLENLSWFEGFGRGTANVVRAIGAQSQQMFNQFMFERSVGLASDAKRGFGELVRDERLKGGMTDVQGNPIETWDGTEYLAALGRWVDSRGAQLFGFDTDKAAVEYGAAVKARYDELRDIPKSFIATEFEKKAIVDGATAGEALRNFGSAFVSNPLGAFSWAVETAARSSPQLVAALGTTIVTRNPMAGATVGGIGTYATERFTSPAEFFKEKGVDIADPKQVQAIIANPQIMQEAATRGVIRGVVIAAFDAVSMGLAGRSLAGNPFVEMAAQGFQQAIMGAGGEYFARLAAGQSMDWNEVLAEGFAELATAPVDAGIAGRRFLEQRKAAEAAGERKAFFEALSGQSAASALRNRIPDRFRQFVDEATKDGPVANVYIPADQFVQYFQGIGVDPYELADALDGVSRDDLEAAIAAGADLQIPTATYAAKIAGSEHDAFLIENMRFNPDEMTAAEAAEFNAKVQDIMDEAFQEAENARLSDEEYRQIDAQVYDRIVSDLRVAGRSTDVATTEAAPWQAFYRTQAQRSGLTPEEFVARYLVPRIEGSLPKGLQLRDVDALTRTLAEARSRKTTRDSRVSLLEFIADRGGINDVGGELRYRNAEVVKRERGRKRNLKLARGGVMTGVRDMFGGGSGSRFGVDDVAQAVVEAGYMADDPAVLAYKEALRNGTEAPDITRALWDAIDRELAGELQFSMQDPAPDADAEAALDSIEEYLSRIGASLDDDDATIRAALEADQAGRSYGQGGYVVNGVRYAVKPPKKLYRGIVESQQESGASGLGTAMLGRGLYSSPDKSFAKMYATKGRVEEVPIEAGWPRNPLVLRGAGGGPSLFNDWVFRNSDYENIRQFNRDWPDPAEFVKSKGYDGVIAGDEVVRYPDASGERILFQDSGGPRGSIQFPAGGVRNGEAIIRLMENANLSTFLHESGHFYLAALKDMADSGLDHAVADFGVVKDWWRENASAVAADARRAAPGVSVTMDDVIAVLDNGTTGDQAKDVAIDTGMHEQWARGFEAYLMEGKAPSSALRTAFEKFRAWMLAVYKSVTGLDVKISDDLRGVFDRLFATDEEIAKARADVGGDAPVFATAEQMGLTPEEFDRFMKLREKAQDQTQARLLKETMEPIRREREKWFKDERVKVRAEAEREVNAYPMFRALEWIVNRRWLGENQPEDMPDMRLSKDDLVRRYGEGVLKTLGRDDVIGSGGETKRVRKLGWSRNAYDEGGVDPEFAAGWFGFDSGDALIQALEKAPNREQAIDAETDKRMFELHGDPLNDGSIQEMALEAIHTDKRGQWIAAELKALSEVAGADVSLTFKEARQAARQTIARMKVRDAMNAGRFLAAERKAAQEAARLGAMLSRENVWMNAARRRVASKARAVLREDGTANAVAAQIERANASTENANETAARLVDAKRRQLLNHALYMEARGVADEVEKAERFVATLNTKAKREKIAGAGRRENAGIDYLAAIDEVLERYDFRKMSGAAEERRGALNAFVEAMKAAKRENELAIPDDVLATARRTPYKTLSVEELRGVVDSLKNMEHVALRWNDAISERRKRELDADKGKVVSAIQANTKKRPPSAVKSRSVGAVMKRGLDAYIAPVRHATSILRQLDGERDLGDAYQAIKADVDAAAYAERDMLKEAHTRLQEIYDGFYSDKEQRDMAVMKFIPELGQSFSKWNLISMGLNMGNEGNLHRLTNKNARFHLTQAQLEFVQSALLDERDARFIQQIWDYLDTFRPKIIERETRTRGTPPPWVEAAPVKIGGVNLRGGYFPIEYNPDMGGGSIQSQVESVDEIMASMMSGRYASAGTRDGHLKARVANVRQSLSLDATVIAQHVNKVIHDLTHSEAVVNAWRILTSPEVEGAMIEAGMKLEHEQLKLWIQDAATGQISSSSGYMRAVNYVRAGFTFSRLAFNIKTMLLQPLGVFQSAVIVGKKRMLKHSLRMIGNWKNVSDEVVSKSKMMWERRDTFNKDVMDAIAKSNIGSPSTSKIAQIRDDYIVAYGLAGMKMTQFYTVDLPTWMAAYEKGMEQFNGDEDRAIQYADMTVNRAQGSGNWMDRSGVERGTLNSTNVRQNPFVLLLTTLGSYFFAKMNLAMDRTREFQRAGVSVKSSLDYGLDMMLLFAGEALVIALASELVDDDKDDEDERGIAATVLLEAIKTATAGLPIIRDAAGMVQGFQGGTYSSLLNIFTKPAMQISQGEVDKAMVKSAVDLTGVITRLPSAQINRAIDAEWRRQEGEDVSPVEYLLGPNKRN